MRNLSCSHTKEQVRHRTKTVTRRDGWRDLKPGTLLRIVEKGMGLKLGEQIVPMAIIRVTSVRLERVDAITKADCIKEGFPKFHPFDFISFFCRTFKKRPSQKITRIEWKYESRCFGCGIEIHPDGNWCGECLCEDDSL